MCVRFQDSYFIPIVLLILWGKKAIYVCIGMKGESESVSVFIETRPRQRPASMSRKEEGITYGEMQDMWP